MQAKSQQVSIVIPTFQEGKYLASILSKLIHTKPKVEIIVVDSGSKDETIQIANRFTKKVYQIEERGISKARNHGLKQASGDVVIFLDADVDPPPDFVEKVLKNFKNNAVVGATCCIMPKQPSPLENVFFSLYNLILQFCAYIKPHSRGEFFAVKKSEFLNVKGFNENMPCLEDHDLALRLAKRGKFSFIKELTVYESLRRFRILGFSRVIGTWFMDYVSFVFRKKPVSEVWQPVR